jgi:hypothetical protein
MKSIQDQAFIIQHSGCTFAGIFDGHGRDGTAVANF